MNNDLREKLIKLIDEVAYKQTGKTYMERIETIVDHLIDNGVTVQRHGRWTYKWDADRDPKKLFIRIVCSECNLHTGQKSNYCPQCGAKMDLPEPPDREN